MWDLNSIETRSSSQSQVGLVPQSDSARLSPGPDAAAAPEKTEVPPSSPPGTAPPALATPRAAARSRTSPRLKRERPVQPAQLALKETPVETPAAPRRREAMGIVVLSLGLFLLGSTASLVVGGKLMGPVGEWMAGGLYALCGAGSLLITAAVLWTALSLLSGRSLLPRASRVIYGSFVWLASAVLLHLSGTLFPNGLRLRGLPPGGAIGEYEAEVLATFVGNAGAVLLSLCVLSLSLLGLTRLLPSQLLARLKPPILRLYAQLRERVVALWPRAQTAPVAPSATGDAEKAASAVVDPSAPALVHDYGDDRDERSAPIRRGTAAAGTTNTKKSSRTVASDSPSTSPAGERDAAQLMPVIIERSAREKMNAEAEAQKAAAPVLSAVDNAATIPAELWADPTIKSPFEPSFAVEEAEPSALETADEDAADADDIEAALDGDADAPIVVPPQDPTPKSALEAPAAKPRPAGPQPNYKPLAKTYQPPPLSVFDYEEPPHRDLDRKAMLELAQRLEHTLGDYLVKGRVTAIHPGPVVTMYEFVPAPGTKLSKITALSSDLAMALEALRVRIVAPIPGKAAVGIEVPNRSRETVFLKEILGDPSFAQAKSKLTMALGKDIGGTPLWVDLAKMPHLLVAGTTGSGKSVSVNGMVCSLLINASPDDVKMIMIDPKMLELSIYEGIPHLLLPVVTDPKKANLALKWAVDEMERRYELISKAGVRDIAGYNKKIEKQLESIETEQQELFGDDDYDIAHKPQKLPYIVVLIDEFADLMMVASKEVEISVARIAQKARAAGIHLILATQRPSVDVITGLIKANFPSRIAFQVASRIDSRTILDAQGAENLLGMGDMLFTDRGQALRRIHGALITDVEVHRVVEHLKQQGQPIYDMEILKPRADEEEEVFEEDMSDELYDQAVRLVTESRQASISMVQRRLRIGYNRAARMIERMERDGIVTSADGAKGREVIANAI